MPCSLGDGVPPFFFCTGLINLKKKNLTEAESNQKSFKPPRKNGINMLKNNRRV